MEKINQLESINYELALTKSLSTLMFEHFDYDRSDNLALDYYSLTRYFQEYNDLLAVINKKLEETQGNLVEIINECYNERKNQNEEVSN